MLRVREHAQGIFSSVVFDRRLSTELFFIFFVRDSVVEEGS